MAKVSCSRWIRVRCDACFRFSLDESIAMFEDTLTEAEGKEMRKDFKSTSIFLYIYTSGTTGLPKAAKISSVRFCFAGVGFAASFQLRRSDRIYCPLPIYHSAGGMLGLSVCLHVGGTFVIRSKFSASNFFKDCHDFDCKCSKRESVKECVY